jgi:hypothetical protein
MVLAPVELAGEHTTLEGSTLTVWGGGEALAPRQASGTEPKYSTAHGWKPSRS